MITLKSCPVCGSFLIARYHLIGISPQVFHEIMPGVKIEAGIISFYFICQNCHMIFQNPRLSDRELDNFYKEGYYRRILREFDTEMDGGEKRRAKTDAEIIKKHVGEVKSHLDLGCGLGYLLEAVGAGIKVGIESDVKYVKVKGVTVYREVRDIPDKKFDLVTAIHILEHVSSPIDYLKKMKAFVKKDGYLLIEVPTWKSPGGPLRLSHLYHFEPDVLKFMCAKVGLKIIHLEFTPHLLLICKTNFN